MSSRFPTRPRSRTPVQLHQVTKVYGRSGRAVRALDELSLALPAGTFTAVMGPSGSGKSTLLHCAAGLDAPTSGSVVLADRPLDGLTEDQLTVLRRERAAFVFQSFNLMPTLNVTQNVGLPYVLAGRRPDPHAVMEAIERVGLADRAHHLPAELSGGQQQRVAIARAVAGGAEVLFADEPTGALDTATAGRILALLRSAVDETGQTIMMTTHDPVAASFADTVVFLVDGRIADHMTRPTATQVADRLVGLAARPATGAR
ncbi:ABC transporter ATP-binding protein [Sphaerisporangium rubeum]|uniref:Putative ABC transport system ATP-binding protein n=1 Tax=Sphaerisporangium rubeum TaxID=321317 RepID=A0A7X0IAQ7_9ACTN|nr:ABC transporter ATP-binding protein [Sphaerisporangium rubeum]MBB6471736.1 putative ABC transport system ATP-binding protein [Sphaerisporangium rubeum]